MPTLRNEVEDLLAASPRWQEPLAEGLMNVSSLARRIRPTIEERVGKPVTQDAVFMALKRHADGLQASAHEIHETLSDAFQDLAVRSPLFQITLDDSPRLLRTVVAALNQMKTPARAYLAFTKNAYEMTITASESLRDQIQSWMGSETVISTRSDLSALSLVRLGHQDSLDRNLYAPLRLLAQREIPVLDIVTTPHELSLLFDGSHIDSAVAIIRNALTTPAPEGQSS